MLQVYSLSPVWTLNWVYKLELWEKILLQNSHLIGFSPLWILEWVDRRAPWQWFYADIAGFSSVRILLVPSKAFRRYEFSNVCISYSHDKFFNAYVDFIWLFFTIGHSWFNKKGNIIHWNFIFPISFCIILNGLIESCSTS